MTTAELIKMLQDALDDAAMQKRAGWTEDEVNTSLTEAVRHISSLTEMKS